MAVAKVTRSGDELVVILPREVIEAIGIAAGDEVEVTKCENDTLTVNVVKRAALTENHEHQWRYWESYNWKMRSCSCGRTEAYDHTLEEWTDAP